MTLPASVRPDVVARSASMPPGRTRTFLRAARVIHPFPTLVNVAATAGLAFVAVRGAPDAPLLLRMLAVMLCAQCAIGVANDYFDRDLDAAAKPWKPIAAGVVSPAAAAALALGFVVVATALAATLGIGGFALAMLGMICGLAYDARLKRTILSAVPYMIAIPTLPLWVWLTLGAWHMVLWWLLPLGAFIGLALHLANTLPDIASDADNGVAGLPHRLGARTARLAAWASFGGALALSAILAPFLDYDLRSYAPAILTGAAGLVASIGVFAVRRDELALQLGFGVLSVASAVLAVGWLAAVT
ncbi:MAG: UbiA family prenyltransferase [Chloroflexota bacterium]